MAAATFQGFGARLPWNSAGTSASPSVTTTDITPGDIIFAEVGIKYGGVTIVCETAGWEEVSQVHSGPDSGMSLGVWGFIVPESGIIPDPTFSWGGARQGFAQTWSYQRELLDPSETVLDAIGAISTNTGSGSPHTCTGVTSSADNSTLFYTGAGQSNTVYGASSGWTERVDNGDATSAARNVVGDRTLANAGTSSGNVSITGTTAMWCLIIVEILEPTAGEVAAEGAPDSSSHTHSSSMTSIAALAHVAPIDQTHAHIVSTPSIVTKAGTTISKATSGHQTSSVPITASSVITGNFSNSDHVTTPPAIQAVSTLAVAMASSAHGHTVEEVSILPLGEVIVSGSFHGQHVFPSPIRAIGSVNATMSISGHRGMAPTVLAGGGVLASKANHQHISSMPSILAKATLPIANSHHAHSSGQSFVGVSSVLVGSIAHIHRAGAPDINHSVEVLPANAYAAHNISRPSLAYWNTQPLKQPPLNRIFSGIRPSTIIKPPRLKRIFDR